MKKRKLIEIMCNGRCGNTACMCDLTISSSNPHKTPQEEWHEDQTDAYNLAFPPKEDAFDQIFDELDKDKDWNELCDQYGPSGMLYIHDKFSKVLEK